jgi:uncharacterized protein Veg
MEASMSEVKTVSFSEEESIFIKQSLQDHLTNLKINNGRKESVQKLQQVIEKLPKDQVNG